MKRIKLFSLAAIFCAAAAVGYNVYQQSTMTEEERLLQANLEALSQDEADHDGCLGIMCPNICTGDSGTRWGWAVRPNEICNVCGETHN